MKLKTTMDTKKSGGNAEQTSRQNSHSTEMITYIEDTPFAVVQTDTGYIVIMGKYKMSEEYTTKKEAEKNAKTISWMRILQVIGATIENYKKDGEEK